MYMRAYALPVLVLFLFAGVFGAFFMFGPMHSSVMCPFSRGEMALCANSVLEHLNHWQIAFSSILAELVALAAPALVLVYLWELNVLPEHSYERIRLRRRVPERPTLLQELFSNGILNPKLY